ncbi:SusC/RagA family TonB-linked outer membrane protein [Aegicerativicinus sediminis]|uniref:SusC/RagA family TonB-linked outer membrane protein n=1 Tax=Aegicerativicinus sediminis TaxID=2893202 RepID=UPI001E55540C|nr:TonB-dependent receptor [Aegicerativicinus sediminis]
MTKTTVESQVRNCSCEDLQLVKSKSIGKLLKWLIGLFLLVAFNSYAQQITVSGKVTSSVDQMPLPGVNVLEKGTTNGAATDFDGNYELVIDSNATLVFSYLGFVTQEVPVNGNATVNVILAENLGQLDEVVVIGYGQQKKSDIAGAVSIIDSEDIQASPAANLSNTLVGQAAGIIAVQRSGEPGEDQSDIFIRGVGTYNDASPIYVIDGIVRSARDFAQLNSNEIESLSVLKDAASAAVFGVRGGNGVILITTKRGKTGALDINVTTSLGIQERIQDPELVGSYEWAQLYNEARVNQGQQPVFTQQDLDLFLSGESPDTHPSSDWLSVLDDAPLLRRYGITANGGSEKIQFATSFGFLDQDGIVPSNNHKRYNFRSNIDANITETTRFSFDISGRDENTRNVASPELFRWLISTSPIGSIGNRIPIKWSNGTYSSGPAWLAVPENGYRSRRIQTFNGRLQLVQKLPIDGLSIKGIASYNKFFINVKNYNFPVIPFYTRNADGTYTEGPEGKKDLYQDHTDNQSITLEAHLNYDQIFDKHAVSALLLYTQTEQQNKFMNAYRDQFTLNIDELAFGDVANSTNWGSFSSGGRQGIVGRLNYTFDEKYIIEGSFRADGSEQFAPGKRWGFFPSGSLAYVISKEPFLEDSSIIDFLKVRGSYGVLGNDRIGGSRFLYLQSYFSGGNGVFGDGSVQPAIYEGNLPSPDVTWETVKKLNVGVDLTLWNRLLSLSFDYFYDQRSDILDQRDLTVPSLLGIGLPVENFGEVDNSGFEVVLGHRNRVGQDFNYSLNANFTYAKSKVVYIDEPERENPNIYLTGRPLFPQFGYKAIGLFQTQEEVDNSATLVGVNNAPGDIRYKDINEDGIIDDMDRVYIGSSNLPEIIFGLNGNVQYKNFELSFLFQGATNVYQGYGGEAAWPFFLGTSGVYKQNLDRWTPTNTDASEPRVLIDGPEAGSNHAGSSYWLRDASYVRLKNLELAYNLDVEKLNSKFIKGIRIYANANNVFTWTDIENFDPENAQGRGWGYPQLRVWNFGVDFNF